MAILPRISEEAKSAVDQFMANVIKLNEIAPLEYIMKFLKFRNVETDVRYTILIYYKIVLI